MILRLGTRPHLINVSTIICLVENDFKVVHLLARLSHNAGQSGLYILLGIDICQNRPLYLACIGKLGICCTITLKLFNLIKTIICMLSYPGRARLSCAGNTREF